MNLHLRLHPLACEDTLVKGKPQRLYLGGESFQQVIPDAFFDPIGNFNGQLKVGIMGEDIVIGIGRPNRLLAGIY